MLSSNLELTIKFNEVDALGIVWHGHYIRFFEDGREAFGDNHGLAYMDIYKQGYIAPLVDIKCNYKKVLKYRDKIIIETRFVDNPAAKIVFKYRILHAATRETVAEGESIQVFLDKNTNTLQLITPEFFEQWKKQNGL